MASLMSGLSTKISRLCIFVKEVDPRKMQINLTGFLNGKNARTFMSELWEHLNSAQNSENGIPQELVNIKVIFFYGIQGFKCPNFSTNNFNLQLGYFSNFVISNKNSI